MPGIVVAAPSSVASVSEMAASIVHREWQRASSAEGWAGIGCVDLKEPMLARHGSQKVFCYLYGKPYEAGLDASYTPVSVGRCLEIYRERGTGPFKQFDGGYLFAVCDDERKEVVVITDRYGLHPLFYRERAGGLVFSSEIKALLGKGEVPEFDGVGLAQRLMYHSSLGERTPYKGIRALPPAAMMRYDGSKLAIEKYWDYHYQEDAKATDEQLIQELGAAITSALRDRLRHSTRPVIPLSGGMDSRTLVAAGGTTKFGCVTFGLPGCDEIAIAKEVAAFAKKEHLVIEYGPDDFIQYARDPLVMTDGQNSLTQSFGVLAYERIRPLYDTYFEALAADLSLGGSYMTRGVLGQGILTARNEKELCDAIDSTLKVFSAAQIREIFTEGFFAEGDLEKARSELDEAVLEGRGMSLPNMGDRFFMQDYVRRAVIPGCVVNRNYLWDENPTYDLRYLKAVMRIPPEKRAKHALYRKFFIRFAPEFAKIRYHKTMRPVTSPLFFWQIGYFYQEGMNILRRMLFRWSKGGIDMKSHRSYVDYERWFRDNKAWRALIRDLLLSERTMKRGMFRKEAIEKMLREHDQGKADHSKKMGHLASLELTMRIFEERK
ncbi:MAG: hypothetical protein HZB92_03910 [Euryarchaeota archaeon]|nr:hypothetical protein [Euryarchaeota archaeon]